VVELVLREARRVVRMERGILITETRHGFVCANSGVDLSNAPQSDTAVLLPIDPDASARALRAGLEKRGHGPLAVVVSDTFGRPWREGVVNVALGVAGLRPLLDCRGDTDRFGRTLSSTVIAVADEIASAAELVMGKTSGNPVVVVRGAAAWLGQGNGKMLLRSPATDMFR
jgi:coenzyme F420-0:L-glutamate ligase/coenzyme F420-1:gamma-L-glutamate ligase